MFRWTGIVLAVLVLGSASAPAPARADPCSEQECGKPQCWDQTVTVRPTLTRALTLSCSRVVSARLVDAPAHSAISDVKVDFYGVHFTATTAADAPEQETARFDLTGTEHSIEQDVTLWSIPLSVNHAPECEGDTAEQRSSGTEPVDVHINPWCRDADGDEFTMTGGGPGVHPQAPKAVAAGFSESNWVYRPSILAGTETTTIAATDVLGARSADAPLSVTIGPDVDRPPVCYPNPAYPQLDDVYRVRMRAGAIRRFPIICSDLDADPYVAAVTRLPTHGALAVVPVGEPFFGDQWYDATYVPVGAGADLDPFSMTATGTHGAGPEGRMAMQSVPEDDNGGGWCGYGGDLTPPDVASVLKIDCADDDGDTITADVEGDPAHGTAGPPVTTIGVYGQSMITVPYVPDPGYEGADCVKVVIDDGHGMTMELLVDIDVRVPPPVYEPPPLPEVPVTPPPLPVTPSPLPVTGPSYWTPAGVATGASGSAPSASASASPPSPAAIAEQVRAYAEGVLGTQAVKRTQVLPDVEVWSPRRLSRRTLKREGRAPGMIVLCSAGCEVSSRAARVRSSAVVTPAQPQMLWASATRRDLRKGRKVRMRVGISRAGAHRTVRRSFRLR